VNFSSEELGIDCASASASLVFLLLSPPNKLLAPIRNTLNTIEMGNKILTFGQGYAPCHLPYRAEGDDLSLILSLTNSIHKTKINKKESLSRNTLNKKSLGNFLIFVFYCNMQFCHRCTQNVIKMHCFVSKIEKN